MQQPPSSGSLRKAAGPFLFLIIFIMICAFLAQYLTGSETLQDYADHNPDLAYGTAAKSPPPDVEPDTASSAAREDEPPPSASPGAKDSATTDGVTLSNDTAYHISEETAPVLPDPAKTADADKNMTEASGDKKETDTMTADTDRITYQEGFYYEPLSEEIKQRITGISYPESGCSVPYEDLNYVGLLYVDFNNEVQSGELICNKAIAQDMVEIFYELYRNDYQLENVRLIDEYGGDDTLSMEHNNTSCFNYRVVDGTTNLSKHALGCAIDINPFYNPYVVYNRPVQGETYISPKGSESYADRSWDFPYKIDENDLCYKLFTSHGFTWGGNWNSSKDYQHFQIVL